MFTKTKRLSLQELIQSSDKGCTQSAEKNRKGFSQVIKVTSVENYRKIFSTDGIKSYTIPCNNENSLVLAVFLFWGRF